MKAISEDNETVDVLIYQIVNFLKNGEPLKMSKRAGTYITVRDVVDALCKDLLRFIMLTRKHSETLYFDLEKVRLKFSDDAVAAIAKEALKRGTGARGLRAILEEVMLEIMYELPSIQGLKECVITREVILNRERPVLVSEAKEQSA